MTVRLSAPPISPVAPCDTLLPELREAIAGKLEAQDLLALSQVSRAWRAAAEPHWQAAYGPHPCHRAAQSPAQWRAAVQERLAIERRVLAPFRAGEATPAALIAVAERLSLGDAPVAALLAYRLAGPAGCQAVHATHLLVNNLERTGRHDELRAHAPAALTANRFLAHKLMKWGVERRDLALCAQVMESGANPKDVGINFCPARAAEAMDAEALRFLLRHPHCTQDQDWDAALASLLESGALDLARELLAANRRYQPAVDWTRLPGEPEREAVTSLLRGRGLAARSSLLKTAGSSSPGAVAACQQLRDRLYAPEAWQQELDGLCAEALGDPDAADLRALRVVRALGGRFHGAEHSLVFKPGHWAIDASRSVRRNTLAYIAGVALEPRPGSGSRRKELFRRLSSASLPCLREVLPVLSNYIRIEADVMGDAIYVLRQHAFDAPLLSALLDMGYPVDRPADLLACAQANNLASVRLLIDRGANAFVYDDALRTAIDFATEPQLVAYLQQQGLTPGRFKRPQPLFTQEESGKLRAHRKNCLFAAQPPLPPADLYKL